MRLRRRIREIVGLLLIAFSGGYAQQTIALVSDTQKPMWIEKLWLKPNHNTLATQLIFQQIIKTKPADLFILGDVVSLGHKEKKWKAIDGYLKEGRDKGIQVTALLGNHDVMGNAAKGESVFQKRFPDHVRTGFVKITDSIAFVLLNSNFSKLSQADRDKQQNWLTATMKELDANPAIRIIVMSCHHAPFSNSKIVGSSTEVQSAFVPTYLASAKAKLFITGHSHGFEHFQKSGKDFMVIGGGGGIHQPLNTKNPSHEDLDANYKPMFHYLLLQRLGNSLKLSSYPLLPDFSGFGEPHIISIR
ncbi:MAG: metallophosphoesterase [Bacteroidetes bacterium]|nr:metallophosphoesterase [Bacteroidota bacterium]